MKGVLMIVWKNFRENLKNAIDIQETEVVEVEVEARKDIDLDRHHALEVIPPQSLGAAPLLAVHIDLPAQGLGLLFQAVPDLDPTPTQDPDHGLRKDPILDLALAQELTLDLDLDQELNLQLEDEAMTQETEYVLPFLGEDLVHILLKVIECPLIEICPILISTITLLLNILVEPRISLSMAHLLPFFHFQLYDHLLFLLIICILCLLQFSLCIQDQSNSILLIDSQSILMVTSILFMTCFHQNILINDMRETNEAENIES